MGICAVSGSIVLTSTLNGGESIKILTIDSEDHLPPNTDFIGAASAYMSNTSVGGEPTQLALSFNGLDLMATTEQYIPASSSSSWYVEFHSMWIQRRAISSSSIVANIGWREGVGGSNSYVYTITSGGISFVFAYCQSNTAKIFRSNSSTVFANSYLVSSSANSAMIGQAFTKSTATGVVSMIGMNYRPDSGNECILYTMPESSGYSYYGYGVLLSNTDSANTLCQYSKTANMNMNTSFFGDTTALPLYSTMINYKGLTIISFRARTASNYNANAAWSPTRIMTPSILADDISANFLPVFCNSSNSDQTVIPVNISNGNITIQLKPDLVSDYLHTLTSVFILINRTA